MADMHGDDAIMQRARSVPFRPTAIQSALFAALLASACSPRNSGEAQQASFDGIGEDEPISMIGTEPFWSIEVDGDGAIYATPDKPAGDRFAISRFAGNGGLGLAGTLDDLPVQIAVTPGECSDGMSDRTYPFTATVSIGDRTLFGCGSTRSSPYSESENPQ